MAAKTLIDRTGRRHDINGMLNVKSVAMMVEKLHQFLRTIDPYRYALTDFILSKMKQLMTDEAALPVSFVQVNRSVALLD